MDITAPMVLADDIAIISGTDLDEVTRRKCLCGEDDYVISRQNSRTASSVVNGAVASLLQSFRTPKTIVEAALEICVEKGGDPETILEGVFGVVDPLIRNRWLLPVGDPGAEPRRPAIAQGEAFEGYSIVACLQVLEDTEVYKLEDSSGKAAALKIARPEASEDMASQFQGEAVVLAHLDGWPAATLLASGEWKGRPYLITEWVSGEWVTSIAAETRQLPSDMANAGLLTLCLAVLKAYEILHEKGVLHGDVYPKNVIAVDDHCVTLVDFGVARMIHGGATDDVARRGVPEYFEPELAQSIRDGRTRLRVTEKAEQYSIAAMLYLLVVGAPYLDFSPVKETALRQIVEDAPLSFLERCVSPWPDMEAVLLRALRKEPTGRFDSVAEFREALEKVALPVASLARPAIQSRPPPAIDFSALDPDLVLPDAVPQCSISYGAAGIAFALLCASCIRNDAKLLFMADAWASRAEQQMGLQGAFTSKALGLQQKDIGGGSVWFGAPGVFLVKALVSQAIGDHASVWNAVKAFCEACGPPTRSNDLTIGKAGQLLGCVLLLDALAPIPARPALKTPAEAIFTLASRIADEVTADVINVPIQESKYLGMAHGSAGKLFALLSWAEISGSPLCPEVGDRLDELASFREAWRDGTRIPIRPAVQPTFMESWCHGTPGYVQLWAVAQRLFKDRPYGDLLLEAATTTWEADRIADTLCCGDAGRAYAMIEAYRHTEDTKWLERAEILAQRAAAHATSGTPLKYALYKGLLGSQVLANDLELPLQATMPLVGGNRR